MLKLAKIYIYGSFIESLLRQFFYHLLYFFEMERKFELTVYKKEFKKHGQD